MPPKILAIDDSLTFRKFISKALGSAASPYEVSLASDGTEGLTKALADRPDLILLDFIMPDLSGEEVCSRLFKALNGKTMPVVLMSSNVDDILATQSRYDFVKGTVAKPFTPELLCDTVEQVLGEIQGAQAAPSVVKANEVASAAASSSVAFSATPATMTIISALLAVQRQRGSGKLTFIGQGKEISLLADQGSPAAVIVDGRKLDSFDGVRFAGWIWTGVVTSFSFIPGDFARKPADGMDNILEWAMESLRMVGDEAESSYAWGDNSGVPAFNRVGYERIQRVALTEEEIDFVKLVDARSSLERIAHLLGWPVRRAQQVIFRFLCLEIFDFWPSAILNANRR